MYLLEDDTHWESTLRYLDICLSSHWPTYSLAKLLRKHG